MPRRDIFFFPSETESFGNVTLEAMASGLPCVCADATGSRSLVVTGVTGLLAPADAAAAFAAHIAALANEGLAPADGRGGAGARPELFLGRDHGAAAGLLSRAVRGPAVKIVDVCEFYSPTGGGVRRYVEQKLEFARRSAMR